MNAKNQIIASIVVRLNANNVSVIDLLRDDCSCILHFCVNARGGLRRVNKVYIDERTGLLCVTVHGLIDVFAAELSVESLETIDSILCDRVVKMFADGSLC